LSDRPRKPRSSRATSLPPDRSESRANWDDDLGDRPLRGDVPRSSIDDGDRPARSRRKPPSNSSRRRAGSGSSDYVDYQPVDYTDDWS
jgi:hypothetical protein